MRSLSTLLAFFDPVAVVGVISVRAEGLPLPSVPRIAAPWPRRAAFVRSWLRSAIVTASSTSSSHAVAKTLASATIPSPFISGSSMGRSIRTTRRVRAGLRSVKTEVVPPRTRCQSTINVAAHSPCACAITALVTIAVHSHPNVLSARRAFHDAVNPAPFPTTKSRPVS